MSISVEGEQEVRRALAGMAKGLKAKLHEAAGTTAASQIRERTAAGYSIKDSRLSPYKTSGMKKNPKRPRIKGATPDLTDSGLMLSGVRYIKTKREVAIADRKNRAAIGMYIHTGAGNNPKGRKWFGVSPKDQKVMDAAIAKEAGKIIRENAGDGYVVENPPVVVAGKASQVKNR
jgi:hypothetical protein